MGRNNKERDENGNFLYHFVYNELGQCIPEKEKPSNTYLDTETNTYKLCYERCSSCDIGGNDTNNNCNECAKDVNDTYLYHFLHDEKGKCINETERPLNTYLNTENNTYELCYGRCGRCDSYPGCQECIKDETNNYIYHFIYDKKGKCINQSEIEEGFFYLDNNDNTYKKCPEGTIKVENDQCIDNNDPETLIYFLIIIASVLIFIPLILILKIVCRKRENNEELNETGYLLQEINNETVDSVIS